MVRREACWALGTSLAIVVVSCLSGCVSTTRFNDLVGTWVRDESSNRSTLVLEADGLFEMDSVPNDLLSSYAAPDESLDWSNLVDRSGSWAVDDENHQVRLNVSSSDGHAMSFNVLYVDRSIVGPTKLYLVLGPIDDDHRFEFSRP